MDSSDWELSKENFQPLRAGRKASALQPRTYKEIQDEKLEFEANLRTYSGPDPLEPWYEYVIWVEQNFPKGGKDGSLSTLLEKCIHEFKNDAVRCQDHRYLEVWLKYVAMVQKPLDIFQFMHANNQCTKLPEFYVAWAWELEQAGKFKEAEMTFRAGTELMDKDDPRLDAIEAKHRQFQARVMKRMVEDNIPQLVPPKEETRSALGSLQGQGRQGRVGSLRVGLAKKSDQPGVLPLSSSLAANQRSRGFVVFQDGQKDEPPAIFPPSSSSKEIDAENLPFRRNHEQENDMKPGKWTQSSLGRKVHAVPLDKITASPAFSVHEDDDVLKPMTTPHKFKPGESKVLSVKKVREIEEGDVPMALFEPFDPNKKPMYCKHLVYQGVTELSFEELRAAKYWKKIKEDEMREKQQRLEKMLEEVREERNKIAVEQEEWKRKQRQEMEGHKEELLRWQKEEFQKLMAKVSSSSSGVGSVSSSDSFRASHLESTAALLQTHPSESDSNASSLHKTPSRIQAPPNPLLTQPSPTVNTKEAFNLMREMWGGSQGAAPAPKTEAGPGFPIHQDDDDDDGKVDRQEEGIKFHIYQDEQNTGKAIEAPAPFVVCCDPECDNDADWKKENVAPTNHKTDGSERSREKVGILRESTSVHFIPLEIQERILDEDEQEQNLRLERVAKADAGNATIKLPTMAAFEQMACTASTPFHGRRFVPDEDENTCAVQIVFKKPLSPEPEPSMQRKPASAAIDENNQVEYRQQEPEPPMSPIMETSREHNYVSSSSSSNSSQSQWNHLTKSQWGNNTEGPAAQLATTNKSLAAGNSMTSSRTPGTLLHKSLKPGEMTTSSGYMADSSTARTPGDFLTKAKARSQPQSPSGAGTAHQLPSKRAKISLNFVAEDKEEDEDEPTGLFQGVMSEFQKNAGIEMPSTERNESRHRSRLADVSSSSSVMKSSFVKQALKASFLMESSCVPQEEDELQDSVAVSAPVDATADLIASFNEEPLAFTSHLKPDSDLTKSVCLDVPAPVTASADNLDLTADKVDRISLEDFDYSGAPFSQQLHALLLRNINLNNRHGYFEFNGNIPLVKVGRAVEVGPYEFIVTQCKGEGSFGKVFGAIKDDSDSPNETISDMDVVLKVQKPRDVWEFYISTELHQRLKGKEEDHEWFMSIPRCFVYGNGSIFVSEQHPCTLLDVINVVNSGQIDGRETREILAIYFLVEMLTIVEKLHECNIIHGDIKPDNFLVQRTPAIDIHAEDAVRMFDQVKPSLILIDFGVSLDMSLFPDGTEFRMVFDKKGSRTPEMLEGKPWSYQIDYFGVTSIVYSLLFGTYIKMNKKENGEYEQDGKFKRWWCHQAWAQFFHDFLNIESSKKLPDLKEVKRTFQELLCKKYKGQFYTVANKLSTVMHRQR